MLYQLSYLCKQRAGLEPATASLITLTLRPDKPYSVVMLNELLALEGSISSGNQRHPVQQRLLSE